MRAVLQRVSRASVVADGEPAGEIENGILALIGINTGDDKAVFEKMLSKMLNLRIFEDEEGKMNLSLKDKGYSLLLVPNFTIYADARKGNRPSFSMGAAPDEARRGFEQLVALAKQSYAHIQTGIFQADMKVSLVNDGPITILLDSDRVF